MPIYIDTRGTGETAIAEELKKLHYPVELKHIESGDYVFGDTGVAIERKTISDLCNSVTGGNRHFWEQLKVMKDTYKKPLILIEGYIDWNDKLLASIIISIVEGWGIPYINSSSISQSAKIIGKVFDRYGTAKTAKIPPPAVVKQQTVKMIKWTMLQCIKGIGGVTAKRIMEEIPNIFMVKQDEDPILNPMVTWNKKFSKIKGLNKESRELLVKVLCNA